MCPEMRVFRLLRAVRFDSCDHVPPAPLFAPAHHARVGHTPRMYLPSKRTVLFSQTRPNCGVTSTIPAMTDDP